MASYPIPRMPYSWEPNYTDSMKYTANTGFEPNDVWLTRDGNRVTVISLESGLMTCSDGKTRTVHGRAFEGKDTPRDLIEKLADGGLISCKSFGEW